MCVKAIVVRRAGAEKMQPRCGIEGMSHGQNDTDRGCHLKRGRPARCGTGILPVTGHGQDGHATTRGYQCYECAQMANDQGRRAKDKGPRTATKDNR